MRFIATGVLAVSAGLIWLASRMTWLTVSVTDDKSGDATHTLVGAVWSTEMTAVALVLLAAVVATLVLRRTARRVVAALVALAAAAASWSPLSVLLYGADPLRVKELLTSGAASQRQNKPILVAQWAQVSNIEVSTLGPALALGACLLGVLAAVLLIMRPGVDTARRSAYETKAAREEKLQQDLADDPDSPRLMWDALDAEVDPTAR